MDKTTKIQIRMTPDDLRALKKLAKIECTTMTGWITRRIRRAAEVMKKLPR